MSRPDGRPAAPVPAPPPAGVPPAPRGAEVAGLGALATVLLSGAWFLPLWQARLHAPQYPGGLVMRAYGNRVTGDVDEIDGLNHYVGMRPFDPADIPEMALWPVALLVAVAAVFTGLALRRRIVGRFARLYLWLLPLGVLGVIQLRLHQFGTDLDPGAALRLEPFTPWVVGPTKVWNFTTWAVPGAGTAALVAAAAVVSFGPGMVGRIRRHRSGAAPIASVVVASLLVLGTPVAAQAAGDHHHPGSTGAAESAGSPAAPVPRGRATSETPAAPATTPLVLEPGTHRGSLVIDEPVVLDGRGLVTLDGEGSGTVLTIRAAGTVVRGITVRGSGLGPTGNPAAIRIEADDVTIEGVVIEDSYIGIAVDSVARIRLVDNHIHGRAHASVGDDGHAVDHEPDAAAPRTSAVPAGRGDGIWLHDADGVLIRGNHVQDVRDGIYVSFGSDLLIDGNHVVRSRYAVHSMFADHLTLAENLLVENLSGAVLMYGGNVLLLRNEITRSTSSSTGFAVLLKDVTEVDAVENLLVDNRIGIQVDGPAGATEPATFTANTVARNAIGLQASSSTRAVFKANSFADNLIQVLPQGGRLDAIDWAAKGWGNYWSSYRGYDALGQGRGAVAHVEAGAVDRLLLRSPELAVLAERPALRLLRSIEERWGTREPVLVDELPLTVPVSPPLATPAAEPGAVRLAVLLGLALLLPGAALVGRPTRRTLTRSHPRAATI
jgi:parallel beta-helix repeat protein